MSSTDGDNIGTESCVINDLNLDDGFDDDVNIKPAGSPVMEKKKQSNIRRKKKTDKREFPPPLPPLLALSHDLSSHIPCELKRYSTDDGGLIILREEKVGNHHHFFRAHRANGRLTLQLVPINHMFPTDSPCLNAHHHDIAEQVQEVEAAIPSSQTGDDEHDETDDNTNGRVSGDERPNTNRKK